MSSCSTIRRALLTALVLCLAPRAIGQTAPSEPLRIPRLSRAPTFEDFLDMRPPADLAREMTMVTDFLQRQPSDGQPASERTEVYLGYDDLNLYAVFVCFDSEPDRIRARLSPRGDSGNDDWIVIVLDTFRDQRNAYMFGTTPLGVEWDALFTEGQGADANYDTLYDSSAGLTDSGYVVWLAMPFKSLRFPAESQQTWGMQFGRSIPRLNEQSFWPSYSTRIEGRLNQAAPATGLENVSPGRNVQLLPFTGFRSFRAIDRRNPARPAFQTDPARFDAGLDAKLVFRDSLVTDVTVNPDFSQVESDEPQVTANERFEVLFPEKRPFFLENAGFFQTPINLVFTRRIADPQFGARLTGKLGRYSIGALVADDQSPGKRAPDGDPRQGRRARFSIVRVNRDIFDQSTVGAIVTERAFDGAFNRVAGADARIKLDDNWVTQLQAVASTTRFADGSRQSGPAYEILLNRAGRQFNFDLAYSDRGAGFLTQTGFNPRNDIRNLTANVEYAFRPEGDRFIAMTPAVTVTRVMARDGTRLEEAVAPQVTWEFSGQTFVNVFLLPERLRLRPSEAAVSAPRDFRRNVFGAAIESAVIASVEFAVRYQRGGQINYNPAAGREASLEDWSTADVNVVLRPGRHLTIGNRYLFTRLGRRGTGAAIFNDHILRTRWNWQFTPELSVRVILQYEALLASPEWTNLETRKNFNADFLVAYQLNAWTAFYAGYNNNVQNIDLVSTADGARIVRTPNAFIQDARQFFAKFSYLVRF